jgi:methanethiol S-methyltransferase
MTSTPPSPGQRAIALGFGLLCHMIFVASVGLMIFHMFFGMGYSLGVLSAPWSWLFNALLLLQFPLGHSFFLSARGRAILNRLAPALFARSLSTTTYVIIASVQVFLLFNFWNFSGTTWWQASGTVFAVLVTLYAASWLMLGLAILNAGITLQTGFLGWWSVFKNRKPVFPVMPVRGLFRVMRQPIYVAFACTVWTVPTWTPDQFVIALVLTAYCVIGPLFKEARFSQIYGQKFIDYQNAYPYWLPFPRKKT